MNSLLHTKFRLNGTSFSSPEELREFAKIWIISSKDEQKPIGEFVLEWLDDKKFISVKTSGSTGVPKVIQLQKEHVYNSAAATVSYFQLQSGTKALLCLPSEYIAGKMMLVRAMIAGWDLYCTSPGKNPLQQIEMDFDFSAMVPYQVHHSLNELDRISKLIVGGGAVSSTLETQLQALKTQVFATYGMTETISHIAVRQLNGGGRSSIYTALPNVEFSQNENNCLQISAPQISQEIIRTNDVIDLISPTSFKLLGRKDNVINSGGIKIHPESVEEKIAPHINYPFFIASEKDSVLGEKVILVIENQTPIDLNSIVNFFGDLSPYEKPKRVITVPEFVYTETGKIRRSQILKKYGIG